MIAQEAGPLADREGRLGGSQDQAIRLGAKGSHAFGRAAFLGDLVHLQAHAQAFLLQDAEDTRLLHLNAQLLTNVGG